MKYERLEDAATFINERLRRAGYLRDIETICVHGAPESPLLADTAAGLVTEAQIANDKLVINTLNKLLNGIEALQKQLLAQEGRIKQLQRERPRSRDTSPSATKSHSRPSASPTPVPPIAITAQPAPALNRPQSRSIRKPIIDRAAQAQLRKYRLFIHHLRSQLRTSSRNTRPQDLTWHQVALPDVKKRPIPPVTTDLSKSLCSLTKQHAASQAALKDAKTFIEDANRYVYTRFVLDLRPSPPQSPHTSRDPALAELFRDWHEIRRILVT
ncbi:HHR125Cp [Eremothecium sinecaudum]|uniref:HHR125Cp n=1 Tax=Eremothecium sinecaudum TaxID=45286 RepID=A0A0X8HWQ6_9SACH|nr:HHR125Cp [Eremothecium sinecaudum]AMD22894.1 HHR125Cp [Eremothecium sinecaudum]